VGISCHGRSHLFRHHDGHHGLARLSHQNGLLSGHLVSGCGFGFGFCFGTLKVASVLGSANGSVRESANDGGNHGRHHKNFVVMALDP
jgi:hypothetical protein